MTHMNLRLTQVQWIGVGGALATFVGMFAPLYSVLTIKITLVSLGWPAAVVGTSMALAAAAIIERWGKWSLGAGLAALGVSLYVLITTEVGKPGVGEFPYGGSGSESGDAFARGLNEIADAALAPQWGWAVLAVGIGAVLFSSFALVRVGTSRERVQPSTR